MKERTQRAIDALLKSLKNDTLQVSNCTACAVGNIISHCMNYHYTKDFIGILEWVEGEPNWHTVFLTYAGKQSFNLPSLEDTQVMKEIDSTGYNYKELAQIEYAFETVHPVTNIFEKEPKDIILKRLHAVVEVILKLDEVEETVDNVFMTEAKQILQVV